MKKLTLEIDGRRVEGLAAYDKGVLWAHINGQTFTMEAEAQRSRRGSRAGAASGHPGDVLAPMPGKIIKINVQKGDSVAAQQVLLVMEAMKMEYTLKAPSDSRVAEVFCEAGEQVTLGQVLMKLDKT